jgi:peptidoglycan hydrolase CwlO-like protein
MAKPSDSGQGPDQLAASQEKLKSAHAKLVKEFEKLHRAKFSAASHRDYLEKLKAHLLALEAHTAAIHAQHEALHQRRQVLHDTHEAEAPQPGSKTGKPRDTESR